MNSPAGYSGTPLPRKLGIPPDATTVLVNAPRDFERQVMPLPPGAALRRTARGSRALTIWFVRSVAELRRSVDGIRAAADAGGVWLAWPKKTSGIKTDVTEDRLREFLLPAGLVDHKVCAIDATWSGLRFARRK